MRFPLRGATLSIQTSLVLNAAHVDLVYYEKNYIRLFLQYRYVCFAFLLLLVIREKKINEWILFTTGWLNDWLQIHYTHSKTTVRTDTQSQVGGWIDNHCSLKTRDKTCINKVFGGFRLSLSNIMVPDSYGFIIQASPKSTPGSLEFGFLPLQIRHFRSKKKTFKIYHCHWQRIRFWKKIFFRMTSFEIDSEHVTAL